MDPLTILTHIALVLMIGVLCSIISKALKLPNAFLLIIMGLFLGVLSFGGTPIIELDNSFIMGISILALVMLAFDSSSRMKLKEASQETIKALKIIRLFLVLSLIVLTLFTAGIIYGELTLASIVFSLIFSVIAVETDLGSVLVMFKDIAKDKGRRILNLLETEANLNTPVVIILPFLLLEFISYLDLNNQTLQSLILGNVPRFLMLIITSIGVGLIVGLVMLKFMKERYSPQFSPIAIIASSLLAYMLSSSIGGDGILAVATMGLIFGNVYVAGKDQLEEFSFMLSKAMEIIIFVMVGIAVKVPFTLDFLARSLFLFAVLVLIRIVVVSAVLKKDYETKEKIFIGLNMPKGITIATVVLVLSTFNYPDINTILQVMVMFMLYSLLATYLIDMNARKFLVHEASDKPEEAKHIIQIETNEEFSKRGYGKTPQKTANKKTARKKKKGFAKQIKKKKAAKKTSKRKRKASTKIMGKKIRK